MLDIVQQAIRDSFPLWTGGAINYSRIERGAFDEGRGGWIVIRFFERGRVCANVGNWRAVGNRDQIASSTMTFFLRECACGSRRIQSRIVAHEVGHALGFEHVTNSDLTMYPYAAQPCSKSDRPLVSPIEQYHAAIAYRRPPGNRDPDID